MLNVSNDPLFGIADYVVFVFVILGSLAIGVYYACANKTTDEYFLGSRKLRIIPVGVSLLVSYLSAITILGTPAEIFYYGVEIWFYFIGLAFGACLCCVTFIPLLQPLKITSINEYVEMRYKKKFLVYACCVTQIVLAIIVNGVVIFGPATMLENFAGVPIWASMLVTSQIATIYTSIGGFKAVIWSDVFQAVGILVGLMAVLILGCMEVGSLADVFQVYQAHERGHVRTDPSLTVRSTIWSYMLGSGIGATVGYGIAQASVQRYSSMPDLRSAQKMLLVTLPGNFVLQSLACLTGVVAFAYYAKLGCDPFRAGVIPNTNQIIPQFIKDVLTFPAMPGIFSACIFCGTVSNLSSAYNCCSALIWSDLLKKPLEKYKLSENRKSIITKFITVFAGLLSTASGFAMAYIGGTLVQMIIVVTGVLWTPLSAFIFLGALTPKTSWKSATIAALASFGFVLYITVGATLYGSNNQIMSTPTHNCSALLNTIHAGHGFNSSASGDETHLSYMNDVLTTYDSQPPTVATTPGAEPEVFYMFRISHVWYYPLGFILANVVGLTLAYVPGFTQTEPVEEKLILPFVRRFMKRKGYQLYEKSANGHFVEPGTEQVKSEYETQSSTA